MAATAELHTTTGTLTPQPPFDWAKTLAFYAGFPPTSAEQTIADGALTKAITVDGRAVAFTVWSAEKAHNEDTEDTEGRRGETARSDVETPRLEYRFVSERALTATERAALEDRVGFFLSIGDDPRPFYALAEADPVFAPVARRLYGLHQPTFLTPFENAAWAVLTQRTPMPMARQAKDRLIARYGTAITVAGVTYRAFPEPATLAAAEVADLGSEVGAERKGEYLRAVAEFFAETDEDELRHGDYDQVAARLRAVRGLGPWSAGFVLIRGLGRTERVIGPERALAEAAGRLYGAGHALSEPDLRALFDRYGPYQGYWAFYVRNASLA